MKDDCPLPGQLRPVRQTLLLWGRGAVVVMALLAGAGGSGSVSAAELACPDFAPFKMTGIPDSRPGIDVEVIQAVFGAMEEPVSFQPVPWKRGLELARAGRVDGLCGCSYLPEREEEFLFSDMLGTHHQGLFSRDREGALSGGGPVYTSISELKGQTVAVVRGYALEKELTEAGVDVLPVVDDAQMVRVLASGRVNVAYAYRDVFRYHAAQSGVRGAFSYSNLRNEPYYLCLSRSVAGAEDRMARFNKGLRDLRHRGTYSTIWNSYGAGL